VRQHTIQREGCQFWHPFFIL